jgi:hypothetical protein
MPARDPAERRAIATIAALARSATESGAERLASANEAYRASFRVRHECSMCKLVEIDQTLPADEIERRGKALYRLHMRRLALRRDQNRRAAAEHQAAADAADAELASVGAQ